MLINYGGNGLDELVKDGVVVVDFFAPWCGPCKMIMPEIEALANKRTDVKFIAVNVDDYRDLALENNVKSIPTLVVYKDGKEVDRRNGFAPQAQLEKWIDTFVK